jgi:hypothetical protein
VFIWVRAIEAETLVIPTGSADVSGVCAGCIRTEYCVLTNQTLNVKGGKHNVYSQQKTVGATAASSKQQP